MNKTAVWIIVIIIVMVVGLCIVKYNKIAALDEGLKKSWTPLSSALEPRYDEIPKLVNEVILYTGKEDSTTKTLADAQKKYAAANGMSARVEAAGEVEAALSNIIIQGGQRYPGIQSHYQFQNLKEGFIKTGDAMKPLINSYNAAVDTYNTYVRKIPNNVVAFLLGFEFEADYFKREK